MLFKYLVFQNIVCLAVNNVNVDAPFSLSRVRMSRLVRDGSWPGPQPLRPEWLRPGSARRAATHRACARCPHCRARTIISIFGLDQCMVHWPLSCVTRAELTTAATARPLCRDCLRLVATVEATDSVKSFLSGGAVEWTLGACVAISRALIEHVYKKRCVSLLKRRWRTRA